MNRFTNFGVCLFFVFLCLSSLVDAKKKKKEISEIQQQGRATDINSLDQTSQDNSTDTKQLESIYNQPAENGNSGVSPTDPNAINYENSTDWITLPPNGEPLPKLMCSVGGFDLSPMTRGSGQDYQLTNSEGTFFVNICAAVTGGGCAPTVSACQRATNNSPYNNGVLAQISLKMQGTSAVVTYGGGQACNTINRSTIVIISCDQTTTGTITSVSINTCSTPYTINMKSKYVCSAATSPSPAGTKSASLSRGASPSATPSLGSNVDPSNSGGFEIGWILIIVVGVLFVIYLVAGFVYKKKRQETVGFVESIPNVEFWKDLPFLVKDGCVFTYRRIRRLIFRESYTQL